MFNRIAAFMLTATFAVSVSSCNQKQPQGDMLVTVLNVNVNCRTGPSYSDAVTETLALDSRWTLVESRGHWKRIQGSREQCWVQAGYLSAPQAAPAAPAGQAPTDVAELPAAPLMPTETFILNEYVDAMSDATVVSAVAQKQTSSGTVELKFECVNGNRFTPTFSSYQNPDSAGNLLPLEFEAFINNYNFISQWSIQFRLDDFATSTATCVGTLNCRYANQVPIDMINYIGTSVAPVTNPASSEVDTSELDQINAEIESIRSEYEDLPKDSFGEYANIGTRDFRSSNAPRVEEANRRVRQALLRRDEAANRARSAGSARSGSARQEAFAAWNFRQLTVRYTAGGFRETVSFPVSDSAVRRVVASCSG